MCAFEDKVLQSCLKSLVVVMKHLSNDGLSNLLQLVPEVEKLKVVSQEHSGGTCLANVQSDTLNSVKQEAAQAQESLKVNKKNKLIGHRISGSKS